MGAYQPSMLGGCPEQIGELMLKVKRNRRQDIPIKCELKNQTSHAHYGGGGGALELRMTLSGAPNNIFRRRGPFSTCSRIRRMCGLTNDTLLPDSPSLKGSQRSGLQRATN